MLLPWLQGSIIWRLHYLSDPDHCFRHIAFLLFPKTPSAPPPQAPCLHCFFCLECSFLRPRCPYGSPWFLHASAPYQNAFPGPPVSFFFFLTVLYFLPEHLSLSHISYNSLFISLLSVFSTSLSVLCQQRHLSPLFKVATIRPGT